MFEYRSPDGSIRREYRPPDEVFHADSLASFALAPVTDDHPAEGAVTDENADRVKPVGQLGENVRRDGDHVAATLSILPRAAVRKVEGGKVQLSCGYTCDLDETPGVTPNGERYDAIQRNIRGNHVAIVEVGRAGPTARIRMDGAAVMITTDHEKREPMDELQKMLNAALADAAAQRTRADAAERERDTARGERDAERVRADAAEKTRNDAVAGLDKLVSDRVSLFAVAGPVLGAEVKLDSMTNVQIKSAVVEKVTGEKVPADATPAYVDGAYGVAIKSAARSDAALASGAIAVVQGRNDAQREDATDVETAARNAAIKASREAYKLPTPVQP